MNKNKLNLNTIRKFKRDNRKITALTAYDYSTGKLLDEAGIDIILVGDSLAMVALGYETTHSVTVEDMLYHTRAVRRGVTNSFLVADMPFMSYQADHKAALLNAGKFIKEGGAQAVKIEGGYDYIVELVKKCTEAGIPVLGHLGFTPQFLYSIGGYNIQGKNLESTQKILDQAKALEEAGAFGIVLEMLPEESAKLITEKLSIPTIGIGAGRYCDGQILVTDDVLGKYSNMTPKFVRKYADISAMSQKAITDYKNDVLTEKFPAEPEIFKLNEEDKKRIELIK